MTFTIFNIVAFRSEDGLMWNLSRPEERLTLTTIPCRLFTYLLENLDKMVSREALFNNIWEKYGFEPSNNSVNQYVSLIRKSLSDLGCGERVIHTVPRVGYYIEAGSITVQESLAIDSPATAPLPEKSNKTQCLSWLPIMLSLVISAGLAAIPFTKLLSHTVGPFPRSSLYRLGNIGECRVYTLNASSQSIDKIKLEKATQLAKEKMACKDDAIFIFHADDDYVENQTGRAFLTRCNTHDATLSKFADCRDVYVYAK